MPTVSLSFKIHIPYRLQQINPGTIGNCNDYFDSIANKLAADKFSDELLKLYRLPNQSRVCRFQPNELFVRAGNRSALAKAR